MSKILAASVQVITLWNEQFALCLHSSDTGMEMAIIINFKLFDIFFSFNIRWYLIALTYKVYTDRLVLTSNPQINVPFSSFSVNYNDSLTTLKLGFKPITLQQNHAWWRNRKSWVCRLLVEVDGCKEIK